MNAKLHLLVLIGIPGAGKSSLAQEVVGAEVVSTDELRRELLGDPRDVSRNDLIFPEFYNRIYAHLREGRSVVADSTALHSDTRERLRRIAWEWDADAHAFVFADAPEAFRRNEARDRVVEDDVMQTMAAGLYRTLHGIAREGFRTVTRVRPGDEALVVDTVNQLLALEDQLRERSV